MAFMRGARPTPRHKLLAAEPFRPVKAPPPQVAYVPKQLSIWGNDVHGDCVSAEEAFAKACYQPEIFIDQNTVESWASAHGVLEGADLSEVLDWMASKGFAVGSQLYNDGPKQGVDYATESVLQAAIATGPVKIAIDANALPQGAGNSQGWYATTKGNYPNTDHCVSLCGYGTAAYLYNQLGVTQPSGTATLNGYLLFTWATIGFVTHDWLMGTCTEAWVRQPTTVGVPPLPAPTPPVPPTPPTPPPPATLTIPSLTVRLDGLHTAVGYTDPVTLTLPSKRIGGAIPWALILAEIEAIREKYGPLAVPYIEAYLATLKLPAWVLPILDMVVEAMLGKTAA